MRRILETCSLPGCNGKLVPQTQLRVPPQPIDSRDDVYGPISVPRRTDKHTPIYHLFCTTCGLMYESAHGETSLEELRREAYTQLQTIPAADKEQECAHCHHDVLVREYAKGPLGWEPEYISRPDYIDPEEDFIGLYCPRCNSIVGLEISHDPERQQQHEAFEKTVGAMRDAVSERARRSGISHEQATHELERAANDTDEETDDD